MKERKKGTEKEKNKKKQDTATEDQYEAGQDHREALTRRDRHPRSPNSSGRHSERGFCASLVQSRRAQRTSLGMWEGNNAEGDEEDAPTDAHTQHNESRVQAHTRAHTHTHTHTHA